MENNLTNLTVNSTSIIEIGSVQETHQEIIWSEKMNTDKMIVPLYLSLLAFHVAHVFEEVWGRFFLMNAVYGLRWYLVGNWILFCIPVIIFYFILLQKPLAFKLGVIYTAIMILNGFGHNIATIVTGRYFDGFAGGFTGIGLVLVGIPLIIFLRRNMLADKKE